MKVCFVTSEVQPFAKTGGLADVSSALARFLHRRGHDMRLFLPLYPRILSEGRLLVPVDFLRDVPVTLGGRILTFSAYTSPLPGSDLWVYLIHCPALFDRPSLYTSGADEPLRFGLLSRASIECCQRMGWAPDVFHCHDWHAALIPVFLRSIYSWDSLFRGTRTVLTIHNLGYQGTFPARTLQDLGLAEHARLFPADDLRAGRIGFLKTGLLHADALTTVSPTYAQEIQTEALGMGLHEILRARRDALVGILNGVDYDEWSPEADPHIPFPYSVATLDEKRRNTKALVERAGLSYSPDVPVVGIISRLTYQKGFDLCFDTLPDLLRRRELRLVVLASGESRYEEFFHRLRRTFPDKVSFEPRHDARQAHLIEAGADLFLMPSRYEPCGLNQMYSLRYGTVPVVRKTGGLADTVKLFDPATGEGTGVVFEHFTSEGLRWALELAMAVFRDRDAFRRLQRNGMAQDFSWERQGRHYESLYTRVTAR